MSEKNFVYVGVNDRKIDLFEGMYDVPNGMAYNSYVVCGEKSAVMDTVDGRFVDEWLGNVGSALGGKEADYLVVQHMEPDHSAGIKAFAEKYPNAKIVGNVKTFAMLGEYFEGLDLEGRKVVVKEGDGLDLGGRTLRFVFAPMVHWPEVMFTFDESCGTLYSADGFGKFGAKGTDEDWACEARRYYFGIVGKYGAQVQNVLKKAAALDIKTICPLHGEILTENLGYYIGLYNTWSAYEPEAEGVTIAYTSVYGHTAEAVMLLKTELEAKGVKVPLFDLARCDMSEAVEDAFKYNKIVLATTTYNGEIFPFMRTFIGDLTERGYKNRTVAFIENGSWAPTAQKVMRGMLENCKDLKFAENNVTLHAAMKADDKKKIKALAEELA